MNKEIETIKAEINTLSNGIEAYHGMVSDKLDSLTKRLDELTVKEKPVSEITQSDWVWNPDIHADWIYYIGSHGVVLAFENNSWIDTFLRISNLRLEYNIFKTKELAESRKHLSPLQRKWAFILDYLGRYESEITFPDEFKYYPFFSIYTISISFGQYIQDRHKSQYATSEEMCLKAIEIMGDDIYPYLGVEKP